MPGWDGAMSADDATPVQSMWHSMNMGRAHIIGISSEAMGYYAGDTGGRFERMMRWLEGDLARAQLARADRPWIILHLHRPAYSSDGSEATGTQSANYRVLEDLLFRHGVDLILAGHVHNMERTLPLHRDQPVASEDSARPYHNARAPVYVVSGAVGCAEEHDDMSVAWQPWTAWRSMAYGYSHMTIHNATHMTFDFQSDNLGGAVADEFVMAKDAPCNFGAACTPPGTAAPEGPTDAAMVAMAEQRAQRVKRLRGCWAELSQTGHAGHSPSQDPSGAPRSMCGWVAKGTLPSAAGVANAIPGKQRQALVDVYHAMGGSGWARQDNWLGQGDPCDPRSPWFGVGCAMVTDSTLPNISKGAPFGVTALQVPANNLRGSLPQGFAAAMAPTLQLFDISDNFVSGSVDPGLFTMQRLHSLFLFGRGTDALVQLQGTLPDPFCTPNLKYLHMQRNNLTGAIPPSVVNCTGLNQIMLFNNSLTGVVPAGITTLPLHTIYMQGNDFACPFPCFHRYAPYANFDCGRCPTPSHECYPCK